MTRRNLRLLRRAGAVAVLVAAVAVLVVVLSGSSSSYVIHAHFENAGQLIDGNLVEVGGVKVGKITGLDLTKDGLADVTMEITDADFKPMHEGTSASIGTVGQSGVTNRFVALAPGPTNTPRLRSGAVLGLDATRPLVDIDAILDSITPEVRRNLQLGTQRGATVLHDNVTNARASITYASAALSRIDAFASQLTKDRNAFEQLIAGGATVGNTLAERETDLQEGVRNTGLALDSIAQARSELADSLTRAPGTLRLGTSVLRELRPALDDIDPTLRDARPVAAPLSTVLRKLVPTANAAQPVLEQLDATLPNAKKALDGIPPTTKVALPSLKQNTDTLTAMLPILTGLRPYTSDAIQSLLHGLGGNASFNYDANGHFARIGFGISPSTILNGVIGSNLSLLSPSLLTKQTDRCPGAATQPPADGSSPLNPGTSICDPKQVPPA